jgi:hypothetical protein
MKQQLIRSSKSMFLKKIDTRDIEEKVRDMRERYRELFE